MKVVLDRLYDYAKDHPKNKKVEDLYNRLLNNFNTGNQ